MSNSKKKPSGEKPASKDVDGIATLKQYLNRSGLPLDQKKALLEEANKENNAQEVLNKAVKMSGRKHMTKVPPTVTGK